MVPASFGLIAPGIDWIETGFVLVLLVFSLGVHEAAHAWTAYKLGDSTGKDMGRMTLNPIVHVDLWMTFLVPIMCAISGAPIFGGAKPVIVNSRRMKNPIFDMAIAAYAGPLSNLLLACVFAALHKFFVSTGYYGEASYTDAARRLDLLPRVLEHTRDFNVLLFVLNLMPLPPFDGARIMEILLPATWRETFRRIGIFGLLIVFYLINYNETAQHVFYLTIHHMNSIVSKVVSLGGVW